MAALTLKKLLARGSGGGQALNEFLCSLDAPIRLVSTDGEVLFDSGVTSAGDDNEGQLIQYQDQPLGWLYCAREMPLSHAIAGLISAFYNQEAVKRSLANEVLDRYRELNLLFRLSEKLLTTAPSAEAIAALSLDEACPMVPGTSGLVLSLQPDLKSFAVLAACGQTLSLRADCLYGEGIVRRVLETGNGEIANLVEGGEYFPGLEGQQVSIICSPLKTDRSIGGVMMMINTRGDGYAAGDLKLLNAIATHTSPVIEMVQLHQFELERTRMERDLYNARKVQAELLPREMPQLDGWDIGAFWQPARVVGGDFYDFIRLPGGKLGMLVADVADKGLPAALIMANTRSVLRTVAVSLGRGHADVSPARILGRVNDLLVLDMPEGMFVTCLLAVLDPATGKMVYANAGHNLPYLGGPEGVVELHATGFPLGIFPNAKYSDHTAVLRPGGTLLIYSDGLPEAHNPQGEMYDYPRLHALLADHTGPAPLASDQMIRLLMDSLAEFTGPDADRRMT